MTRTISSLDAVRTLELFNAKAEQLLSSGFFEEASGGGAVVEFKKDSGWDSVFVGPEEESTRALVLTLRLFMQDADGISLRELAALYGALPLSAGVVDEFTSYRSELNAFLDSASRLAISDEASLTYRNILEIFVYGEYAHLNMSYRATLEDLRTTRFFPLVQSCLVDAVIALARCVRAVQGVNRRAIDELTPLEG